MGYNYEKIKITGTLSAHNDERDETDRRNWAELRKKIDALVKEPPYDELVVVVEGGAE